MSDYALLWIFIVMLYITIFTKSATPLECCVGSTYSLRWPTQKVIFSAGFANPSFSSNSYYFSRCSAWTVCKHLQKLGLLVGVLLWVWKLRHRQALLTGTHVATHCSEEFHIHQTCQQPTTSWQQLASRILERVTARLCGRDSSSK